MRPYRTKKYMDNLAGNKFISSCDDLAIYTGLKVRKILRELTEKEYDKECIFNCNKRFKNLWLQFFLSQNQGFMRLFEKTVLK